MTTMDAPDSARAMRAPTIFAFGLFGSPNFGNEASMAAFLEGVRRRLPSARFKCIAPKQSVVEARHSVPLVPVDPMEVGAILWRLKPRGVRRMCEDLMQHATEPRRASLAEELLVGASALVIPGTGLLDDFGQRPLDMPSHLDRWTAAAKRRGVPIYFLSVGVSKVKSATSRRLFARALRRADYCSFRDDTSRRNAEGWSCVPGHVVPDLAFSLRKETLPVPAAHGRRVIGLGVMGYSGWNEPRHRSTRIYGEYLRKTCTLVEKLVSGGYKVRLCTGDAKADRGVIDDILSHAASSGVVRDWLEAPRIDDYRDVMTQLAGTDVVIAARYHNLLLALLLEKPTISLAYSDKNIALMDDFGRTAYSHDVETYDVDVVVDQVHECMRTLEQQRSGLGSQLARARRSLEGQYDRFCGMIANS